jgi:hypothetical protein
LKLYHDELLSSFAFKFNLRRYTEELALLRLMIKQMHRASTASKKTRGTRGGRGLRSPASQLSLSRSIIQKAP